MARTLTWRFVLRTRVEKQYFASKYVRGYILLYLGRVGKQMAEDAALTTVTWNTPVIFRSKFKFKRGDVKMWITSNSRIWTYLNEGTSVRWSVMNDPYERKTSHAWNAARKGYRTTAGKYGDYTALRGKKAMTKQGVAPRAGIDARDWTGVLKKKYIPIVEREMTMAIRDGLIRGGAKKK